MDANAWLLPVVLKVRLDSIHYVAQTMQELDSIHCDRARVRTNDEGRWW